MASELTSLSPSLDAWCDWFEDAWQHGQPDLAEVVVGITDRQLAAAKVTRRELLEELIKIDLEYQWRRASEFEESQQKTADHSRVDTLPEPPTLDFYLKRFPRLDSVSDLSGELIAEEYRVRWRWGDKPARQQFFVKFRDRCDSLTEHLDRIDLQLREATKAHVRRELRCPSCREIVHLNGGTATAPVSCPKCGQEIRLVGELTTGSMKSAEVVQQRLAHFELLEKLGSGTFGVVWKARDIKLDRIVAVKVARQTQLAGENAANFLREARAAAQLRHTHIVRVYEAGQEGDTVYLVCDYVDGTTLDEWAADRRPTFREAAQLCMKISQALEHAHKAGVVHRDLKPGNIMMDVDDEPRLMDFGLARREAGEVTMTVEGQILGTPAYMSPEQAAGLGHQADRRSDLYSLGVVLYELLTGVRPFQGNLRMLLKQLLEEDVPSPSKFADRVPKDLETICLKCLEKSPDRRFDSAQDLSNELGRYLRGEPIVSRPLGRIERGFRWCRRKPLVAGIGVLLLLLFAASIVAGYQGLIAGAARNETRQTRIEALWTSEMASIPDVIKQWYPYSARLRKELESRLADAEKQNKNDRLLRARLALVKEDRRHAPFLSDSLRRCDSSEVHAIAWALKPYAADGFAEEYWAQLEDPTNLGGQEFLRVCAALVAWQIDSDRWTEELARRIVVEILNQPLPAIISEWRQLFAPLGTLLAAPLCDIYRSDKDGGKRDKIIYVMEYVLVDYADAPTGAISAPDLAILLCETDPRHYSSLNRIALSQHDYDSLLKAAEKLVQSLFRDQESGSMAARGIEFLTDVVGPDYLWSHLEHSPDPSVRSFLVSQLRPEIVTAEELASKLVDTTEDSIRRAILLTLGRYPPARITDDITAQVVSLYRDDPDPGIHSAAMWSLQKWGVQPPQLKPSSPGTHRPGWFVNSQGQVMVMLPAGRCWVGSPLDEIGRKNEFEDLREEQIEGDFAIAATEMTVEQFLRFKPDHKYDKQWTADKSCPVGRIRVRLAGEYCNWLSEREGLPESEWCFPVDPNTEIPSDYQSRSGYRLPTSAEWEYACRVGTNSARFYGQNDQLLENYCWYVENSGGKSHPVASLMPNDWGLFDLYGNARERTIDMQTIRLQRYNEIRGETVEDWPDNLRSAMKNFTVPERPTTADSFRIVRTLPGPKRR